MMFLYLIIGVVVLSQILYIAGVSVTDEIVVPDTIQVTPDYYEDTTYPSGPEGDVLANGFHLETVTIPIRGLLTTEGSGSSSRRSCRTSPASASSRSPSSR